MLSDFGGYLGLFIGASALSLSNVALNYFFEMMQKFKNRVGYNMTIEQIVEDTEGQQEIKLNDKVFEDTRGMSSTSHRMSQSEIEKTLTKLQKDFVKLENKIRSKPHGLSKRNK